MRVTAGRGRGRQSPARGRQSFLSFQVPKAIEEQSASLVARQTLLDDVTAQQRPDSPSRSAVIPSRTQSSTAVQAGASLYPDGESANQLLLNRLLNSVNKLQDSINNQQLSPANVWSAQSLSTVSQVASTSNLNYEPVYSLPVSPQVPEISFKEPLPCEISPLGFYLTSNIKEKIWRGKFIDLLTLFRVPGKEFSGKNYIKDFINFSPF